MLRGLATISYYADDLPAAVRWYADFLDQEPYFNVPGYSEFRIGDYQHELGLIDRSFAPYGPAAAPAGVIAYWHVDDVPATLQRLLALGAEELDGIRERGHGFVTASVLDPFGNVLGVMSNPHYVEVLDKTGPA
jgi:predicted enzyme related to lactoylglutathione lyase